MNNPILTAGMEYDINNTLKTFGGDITKRPIDDSEGTKKYLEDIQNIERALNSSEGKLKSTLYVYKNDSLYNFAEINDEAFRFTDNPNFLHEDKVDELKENLSRGISNEFLICDLADLPNIGNETVKWRIKIPKGTSTGYLENKIILDRNMGIEVIDTKISVEKGKEFILIDAEVISKEKVEQENKKINDQENNTINMKYFLPENSEFLNIRMLGLAGAVVSKQINETMKVIDRQIDNDIIKTIINFMLEKNGKLIITDSSIVSSSESYEPKIADKEIVDKYKNNAGVYNLNNRTIVTDARNSFEKGSYLDPNDLIHEIGHAVDHCAGDKFYPGELKGSSSSLMFQEIFDTEKNNLTDYAKKNEREFFAEAFRLMHSENPEDVKWVKEKAPDTYKFINDMIKYIT